MDKNPLISIITPAYNAEKYLGEAIESVLQQTYGNWELIIVDDGSTDGTARLAKEYAEKDSRIFYCHQENKRMASARNTGIAKAKGKYIAFLDADNVFLPQKLERQAAYLEAHPACGVSYGRILHFYEGAPKVFYKNKNEAPLGSADQLKELLRKNSINVLAVLGRKEIFDRYGAFMEGWRACDEHYVWINLANNGVKFCYLDEIVGLAREHRQSDSRRKDHLFDTADKFLELLDILESSFSPEKRKTYEADILQLRKSWRLKRFLGILLKNPFFSWILLPLYLSRRERNFARIDFP